MFQTPSWPYTSCVKTLCCTVLLTAHGRDRQARQAYDLWCCTDILSGLRKWLSICLRYVSAFLWPFGKRCHLAESSLKSSCWESYILCWKTTSQECITGEVGGQRSPRQADADWTPLASEIRQPSRPDSVVCSNREEKRNQAQFVCRK